MYRSIDILEHLAIIVKPILSSHSKVRPNIVFKTDYRLMQVKSISTANIKALRGSLGALSVNKLSHIPKLQPISAVNENQ